MRPSLWFVIPAHGRLALAEVCLRQLARTCATLTEHGLPATAVVIADDQNLDIAAEHGFHTVEQANAPLGRKINDGYEYAGRAGADYLAAFGTDDWIDPQFILDADLPRPDTIRCNRLSAVVSEDGQHIASLRIPYDGGDGVRIMPRQLLAPFKFRPAKEHAPRALDTSVMTRLQAHHNLRVVYHDSHPWQIIDWKSETQLNSYQRCLAFQEGPELADPFAVVAAHYPPVAVAEMQELYGLVAA